VRLVRAFQARTEHRPFRVPPILEVGIISHSRQRSAAASVGRPARYR
jgi:hypothetical protein